MVEEKQDAAASSATRRSAGDEPSDAVLLERVAAGDQSAAAAMISRHGGRVLALARRMLSDNAEAEDVAQDAMMRIWRIAGEWRQGDAQFSTWLHRVTLNLCYDRLRKKRGAPLEDAPEPADPALTASQAMEVAQSGDALRAAMADLPERQRQAITLRHFEELSNPEIAEALDVSVEAVESLLSRGRRALRNALAHRREELL